MPQIQRGASIRRIMWLSPHLQVMLQGSPYVAMQQKQDTKTMCQAKQELSQPSTQPDPPIRSQILNKLLTPVRADTLEILFTGL